MTSAAYDNVIRDLLGVTTVGTAPSPSWLLAVDPGGDISDVQWRMYLSAADQIAAAVMGGTSRSNFITCDPSGMDCLTSTIKTFGRKAFRRPLTDAEVTSFLRLANTDPPGTPDEVAEAILYTFLASPSFIMLPELGSDKEGDAIKLTSYEVATRLSFLVWNSVPDGALSDAADNDALQTSDQIFAQAQRMLKDDRTQSAVTAFGHAYLGIAQGSYWLNNQGHDTTKFPKFSAAAAAPMLGEVDAFIDDVTMRGGSFEDLLLSNVAFVNRATAPLYGLDATQYGDDLKRVELDASQRPGILTRVAFLSTFSHFDATAPALRGAFIMKNVQGVDPGPPPPSSEPPPVSPGQYDTVRQQMEALTSPAQCAGCHAYVNPSGFVLEHYDAVGSWQDQDPLGGPIDGSADLILSDSETKTVSSPLELMTALAGSAGAQHHFAEALVAYATGRDPNANDACVVDELAKSLTQSDYRILDLFADYTRADSFRLRVKGN